MKREQSTVLAEMRKQSRRLAADAAEYLAQADATAERERAERAKAAELSEMAEAWEQATSRLEARS